MITLFGCPAHLVLQVEDTNLVLDDFLELDPIGRQLVTLKTAYIAECVNEVLLRRTGGWNAVEHVGHTTTGGW